jgi:hypothetical protein
MRVLGWVGLEPTTNALKGRCSTVELPTHQETSSESITKSLRCKQKPERPVPVAGTLARQDANQPFSIIA